MLSVTSFVAAALLSLLAAGTAAVLFPIAASGHDENSTSANIKTSIVLTRDSAKALSIIKAKPDIMPGESIVQKEIREKAEAALALARTKKTSRDVVSRERRVYSDPSDFSTIYKAAEARFGVDARILHAIHYVETGCSGSTYKTNASGAAGPMQFLPSTFRRHAVDGNGDGVFDIYNVEDAIFTAAAYLRACGYPDVKKALWGYNPSYSYYHKVMEVAKSLGYES